MKFICESLFLIKVLYCNGTAEWLRNFQQSSYRGQETNNFSFISAPSKSFLGVSGSEDRGGGDNTIQPLILGRWVTKVLKDGDEKLEGVGRSKGG